MGKIRQWLRRWFDRQIELSFQRKADKMFKKHDVEYRDGDNT